MVKLADSILESTDSATNTVIVGRLFFFLSSFIYPGYIHGLAKLLVFTNNPASFVQCFESLELVKLYIGKKNISLTTHFYCFVTLFAQKVK